MSEDKIIHCPDCVYYYAPVCTFYKFLPMTSRKGFCYHAIKGKYKGKVPTVPREGFERFMNPPEEDT